MKRARALWLAAAAVLSHGSGPAWAQQADHTAVPTAAARAQTQTQTQMQTQTQTPMQPQAPRTMPALGKRLADTALAQQRGGTDTASGAAIKGLVTDNQAVNVTTGGNLIGGGSFAAASGVPVVIQNSGNNVLIQSSTVVNVQLK